MTLRPLVLACVTRLTLPALAVAPSAAAQTYDIVLTGGRVMDPESGLDAVRSIGINDGTIRAISQEPLTGRQIVDVSGLVVAPGFIDLHAHGQDPFSRDLQVRDGVTTALELESGVWPVDEWYAEREGNWRINFGATTSYGAARNLAFESGGRGTIYSAADPSQVEAMQEALSVGLARGALGVGIGLQYIPGATRSEILRAFQTAAAHGVTVFVHIRYAGLVEPESSIAAVQEMIADAAGTGGSVHIVHIGSSGLEQVPVLLDLISAAHESGVDVTTEVYPYTAASTNIQAAILDRGWRERLGADYSDIEWVASGERLDSVSFEARREEGGMIIAHVIPEEEMMYAVSHPSVMIASDGVPYVDGRAHPRGAGSFARVLGRYSRDAGALPLMEAIRKMTLMPAQRLEVVAPAMAKKGRIAVGADADLTIFNPDDVIDRATFENPAQPSAGIPHVLVNGRFVVRDGALVEGVMPGKAIRRTESVLDIQGAWSAERYYMADGGDHEVAGRIFFTDRDWQVLFLVIDEGGVVRRGSGEGGTYTLNGRQLVFTHLFNLSAGEEMLGLPAAELQMVARGADEAPVEPTRIDVDGDVLTFHFPSGNRLRFRRR